MKNKRKLKTKQRYIIADVGDLSAKDAFTVDRKHQKTTVQISDLEQCFFSLAQVVGRLKTLCKHKYDVELKTFYHPPCGERLSVVTITTPDWQRFVTYASVVRITKTKIKNEKIYFTLKHSNGKAVKYVSTKEKTSEI